MTEVELKEQLSREPFVPFRMHLASGKTFDVLRQDAAWHVRNCLLMFVRPSRDDNGADSFNLISYANIERIKQLQLGKRTNAKRKPA